MQRTANPCTQVQILSSTPTLEDTMKDIITDMKQALKPKIEPYWVTASNDSMNKVLKTAICLLYVYAMWLVVVELWDKFV